jgi:hypothetical protein
MWKSVKELLHLSSHGFHVFAVSEEYCVKAEDPQVLCFSYELRWISGREIAVPSFACSPESLEPTLHELADCQYKIHDAREGVSGGETELAGRLFSRFQWGKTLFPHPGVKKCCRLSRQAKLTHCNNNCTMLSIRAPFLYNQSPGHPEIH